jgi:hypothetical protein
MKRLLSTSVALALLASMTSARAEVCAACSMADETARLCAAHEQAESAALARFAADIGGADSERAMAALEALAALTSAHDNAPSERVARALARGLESEDLGVRRTALRLLRNGQHQATARSAVMEAARRCPADALAYRKALEKQQAKLEKRPSPDSADLEDVRKSLEEMTQGFESMRAAQALQLEHGEYAIELAEALALGNDAELDLLLRLADALKELGFLRDRLVAALLLQGRQDAVARAVDVLEVWDLSQRAAKEELTRLERERREQERRAGDDAAGRIALAAGSRSLESQRARVEASAAAGRALHDAFVAGVRARGLDGAPEWNGEPLKAWRAWLQRNRAKLPKRIDATPRDG